MFEDANHLFELELIDNPGLNGHVTFALKAAETVPDDTRRQLNVAFFEAFFIDDDPIAVTHAVLTPPFEEIQEAHRAYERASADTSDSDPDVSDTMTPIEAARGADDRTRDLANQKRHGDAVASEAILASVLADVFPVRVSSKQVVVAPSGLEPLTPGL